MTRVWKTGIVVVLAVALLAAPGRALAEICEDLWFTRNALMHRAGYCFESPLGRAVFDGAGCRGRSVSLDQTTRDAVDEIRRREQAEGCALDTSAAELALRDLAVRRSLIDLPIRDEFESGCVGWRLEKAPLRAGHRDDAQVVGWMEPGDFVRFSHVNVGDWSYATVFAPDWKVLKGGGWVRWAAFNDKSCDGLAG